MKFDGTGAEKLHTIAHGPHPVAFPVCNTG